MKNVLLILILTLTGCQSNTMNNDNFNKKITDIANSDLYQSAESAESAESMESWDSRGLIPSDDKVNIMTEATNDFLSKLEKIHYLSVNQIDKREKIEAIVDELPWDALDTEEKEFLADILAPAIQVAGFNPWDIF